MFDEVAGGSFCFAKVTDAAQYVDNTRILRVIWFVKRFAASEAVQISQQSLQLSHDFPNFTDIIIF